MITFIIILFIILFIYIYDTIMDFRMEKLERKEEIKKIIDIQLNKMEEEIFKLGGRIIRLEDDYQKIMFPKRKELEKNEQPE